MSDGQAAEGPAFWSPAARRGSAGGVGDRRGVEESQAAASGTQGPGAGRVGASWLRAMHLGRPVSPLPRGPRLRSRSFSTLFGNTLVPVPASFLGAPGLAVRLLPPRLFGVSRGPHPTSIPAAHTPAPVFGSPRDPTSVSHASLSARSYRGLPGRPPSSRFALA